jgi:uncharacterized protein
MSAWSEYPATPESNGAQQLKATLRLKQSSPTTPAARTAACSLFRDFYPGGVLHTFPYLLDVFSTVHEHRDVPGELSADEEKLFLAGMANPDFKMYANLYNILTQKGQRTFIMYHSMVAPWELDGTVEAAEQTFKKIKIPFYTGSGAYAYTYKLHWLGAQHYFQNVKAARKLLFTGPAHLQRRSTSTTMKSSAGTTIG